MRRFFTRGYTTARKIVVAVVGGTIIMIGIAMMVLPGPAIVVIPAGVAVLALEFAWARRWLRIVKERVASTTGNEPSEPAPPS